MQPILLLPQVLQFQHYFRQVQIPYLFLAAEPVESAPCDLPAQSQFLLDQLQQLYLPPAPNSGQIHHAYVMKELLLLLYPAAKVRNRIRNVGPAWCKSADIHCEHNRSVSVFFYGHVLDLSKPLQWK